MFISMTFILILQEELTEELEEMHAVINKLLQKLPRPCYP